MCKIALALLWFSVQTQATEKFSLSYSYRSLNSTSQLSSSSNPEGTFQSQNFGYQKENIIPGLGITGSFVSQQPDYSKNSVLSSTGQQQPISRTSEIEYIADMQMDYGRQNHNVGLGGFSYLSESPYFQGGIRGIYKYSFYGATSTVGVRAQYIEQERPQSYFYNESLQLKPKSTNIYGHEYAVFYEQVLNKNWKMVTEFLTSQRVKDRPPNYGVSLKQAYALSSKWFSTLKISHKAEDTSQRLYDDRGYFSATGADATVTFEPKYDILISASYGLNIEQEKKPQDGSSVRIGSDQLGIGIRYPVNRKISLEIQGAYALTNTDVNGYFAQGGVVWVQ